MKNYYEILQVSKNASKEIIEKAYKTLVKTYHPDIQKDEDKKYAEEKMKQINEAYEILSDDIKKSNYDLELEKEVERKKQEEIDEIQRQARQQQIYDNDIKEDYTEQEYEYTKKEWKKEKKRQRRKQREEKERREREYIQYMRKLGYNIKERWTLKKTKRLLMIITVLILAGLVAWFLPPSHDAMIDLYNENVIIRVTANVIIAIVKGIFVGTYNFFKMIFTKN